MALTRLATKVMTLTTMVGEAAIHKGQVWQKNGNKPSQNKTMLSVLEQNFQFNICRFPTNVAMTHVKMFKAKEVLMMNVEAS